MLDEKQTKHIKNLLLKNLEKFPRERRDEIKKILEGMSAEELEDFIKKNNLYHLLGECVFCGIVSGKLRSFRVGENEGALAVLDINPLSKAHVLVISKKHLAEVEKEVFDLADEIKSKIQKIFSPKNIKSRKIDVMGHGAIEIVPEYDGQKLERKKADEKELEEIVNQFYIKEEKAEVLKEPEGEVVKLPPRIPHGPLH